MAQHIVHGVRSLPEDKATTLIPRPAPHAPVRSITAPQLAQLVHEYNTTDVDDAVLYPFLHGLEGNNVAQNLFFNHARNKGDRPKVPHYRGLMLVRTDEPGLALDARGNIRDETRTANDEHDEEDDDDDDDDDEEDDDDSYTDEEAHPVMSVDTAAHMHPVAHRAEPASPNDSVPSPAASHYFASPTSSAASLANTSPPSTPAPVNKVHDQAHPTFALPRKPSHVLTCSFHPDELLTNTANGPVFINPRIPDGISLRNFGIQVPIYATLSDIVVYSPKGATRNAFALAEKFKQAIETKAIERNWVIPGTDGQTEASLTSDAIAYNVYLVVDSFETFEQEFPHLVAVDSSGTHACKVDFMEREKEEMRTLTRASEIAEGVWLGNTSDVPLLSNPPTPVPSPRVLPSGLPVPQSSQPVYDPFDGSNNPSGYDICIECHDMASFPTFGQLRSVEDRLRNLEEGWRSRVREAHEREMLEEQRRSLANSAKKRHSSEREDAMELDSAASSTLPKGPSAPSISTDNVLLLGPERRSSPTSIKEGDETDSPVPSGLPNARPADGNDSISDKSETPVPTPLPTPPTLPTKSDTPLSSTGAASPKPSASPKPRTLPPRPPPHAAHVIHLSFPSSPPATPGTLTNLIPFLHFLHSLARPRPVTAEEVAAASGSSGHRTRSPSVSSPLRTSSGNSSFGHSRNSSGSNLIGLATPVVGQSSRTRSYTLGSKSSYSKNQQSQPASHLPLSRPLKILLHAGDGYTETSVLALSYLMLAANRTLPEAYLELQVTKERSFFVYGADVGILRRVESRLKAERERERERIAAAAAAANTPPPSSPPLENARAMLGSLVGTGPSTRDLAAGNVAGSGNANGRWKWSGWKSGSLGGAAAASVGSLLASTGVFGGDGTTGIERPSVLPEARSLSTMDVPSTGVPSTSSTLSPVPDTEVLYETPPQPAAFANNASIRMVPAKRPSSLSQSYAVGQGPSAPHRRARASTSPFLPSFVDHDTWFNDPKFDGSFPSRVLPFLYLGNLAHASNAYMLHALGITHVVSVGECALVPPASEYQATVSYGDASSNGTLQYGPAHGTVGSNGGALCGYGPSKAGHGTLWMEEREGRIKVLDIKGVCDDGIDSLRPQIAPTVDWIDKARLEGGKILIHCRVGVSRSATVTIAYVMQYLNCSLVDAYLMVRSRRLSVLIQPNMRLLYNLCGWEIELARRRAEAEGKAIPVGSGRQFSWPFLAREVHILNERYLS